MAEAQNDGWTLAQARRDDGTVDIVFEITRDGTLTTIIVNLTREEARTHARGVLAAAGDAIERTFGGEGA
ncbi:hypothetical protein [Methylobacterium soli]|uniref:Uncharacterized protein n=1 Tax=Methylobacterium soli TaxID=553447 RepID=A0A6L3SZ88_9HYPH|nr:hypothetical protein [Methylobacterium soli]KAB1079364.1 hypothetical protein F6X53_11190 [Methylobacterium soli]GJE44178.1 hypothetical protein AEGHOMDF_3364 [Methylobacterium soli]